MPSNENTRDSSAASVALTAYEVKAGDVLQSSCSSYSVLNLIGEGTFGKIAASIDLRTKQNVAVKILKKRESTQDTKHEVSMLKLIGRLDSAYMVRFHEQFVHMEQNCLVFERLDISLYDLQQWRQWKYLPLNQIRPIAKQVFEALDALKGIDVIHADIKPDNIMFVHLQNQPLRVKLIDFGCSMMKSKIHQGMYIQPNGYRAPEISLGLPFTEAVDVWGVGCVLAFLYMAQNPFCISSDYQMMKGIVTVLGQPEDRLLRDGNYSRCFFIEERGADRSSWRLMTAEEFRATNCLETEGVPSSLSSLISLIFFHPSLEAAEMDDRMVFVSLLNGLLHVDGDQRITPRQALRHPFITMSHLRKDGDSWDYRTSSQLAMKVCPSANSVYCATSDSSHCATSDSSHGATSDSSHGATSDSSHGATSDSSHGAISEKGYTESMDKVSCEALVSTSAPKSSTGDKYTSSEVLDSDLSTSKDTSVPSIKDDDTSELSWCSDATVDDAAVDDAAVDEAAVDDVAVDEAAVDDAAVDDVAVDDAAVDDAAVDDAAVDVAVDDVALDDAAVDMAVDDAAVDVALDDVAVDDVAVDDVAVDDVAVDDVAFDDVAFDDVAFDDVALDDGALDDGAFYDVALDDVAVDVTAAATASSGGKRKWLRRIQKFFSSPISFFRRKVDKVSCEALVSTSAPKSSTGDKYTSSEVLDSDLSTSKDTSVPSIKDDDTSELSWCSDATVDDVAVDDAAVDEAAVDDVAVDDAAVDVAVDDVALDDAAVDMAVDDAAVDDAAVDVALDDVAVDDVAFDDVAFDDVALDDVALDDGAFYDVPLDDVAVDVTAAATASSGGKRKWLRRIQKFFSSPISFFRRKVDKVSCEALVSTSAPKSSTGDKYTSSEVLDSDLSTSKDTSVPSIKDDDTSELSWCSDATVDDVAVDDAAVDEAAVDDVAVDDVAVDDVAVDDAAVDVAVDVAVDDVAFDDVALDDGALDDGAFYDVALDDVAVDVTAAATASSGGKRKWLRRIQKFFSSLISFFRRKVED
ncbi:uncharacterized protein [Paralichthys olivaceus]|uniref:uncharacterized protein n=1 Tax=Paralichthys olivaceus TaxID=8255 RepID=UPI0037529BF5